VLLHMIENNVTGLYIFTTEEEVGCVGATEAAKHLPSQITQAITFDRKDTCSVISKMSFAECGSAEFIDSLASQLNSHGLNVAADPTGSTTDTEKFRATTNNHTNISAGYYDEHTPDERLDLGYLQKLMAAAVKVDWESLPDTKRPDPKPVSYGGWGGGYGSAGMRFADNLRTALDSSVDMIDALECLVLECEANITPRMVYSNDLGEILEDLLERYAYGTEDEGDSDDETEVSSGGDAVLSSARRW